MSFLTLRLRWKVKLISRSWISHRNVWTFRFSPRVTSFGSCEFLINHYHVEKPFMNPFMRRPNTFWFTSVDVLALNYPSVIWWYSFCSCTLQCFCVLLSSGNTLQVSLNYRIWFTVKQFKHKLTFLVKKLLNNWVAFFHFS